MNTLAKLKAAGARHDGVNFDRDGKLIFRATNAGGAWTEAQKAAVIASLGRPEAQST
jgi:hypothetical protein